MRLINKILLAGLVSALSLIPLLTFAAPTLVSQGGTATSTFGTGGLIFSPGGTSFLRPFLGTIPGCLVQASSTEPSGFACVATSSIGYLSQWLNNGLDIYYNLGNVGVGTSSPYSTLSVVGKVVAANYDATTTATSTFNGNIYFPSHLGVTTGFIGDGYRNSSDIDSFGIFDATSTAIAAKYKPQSGVQENFYYGVKPSELSTSNANGLIVADNDAVNKPCVGIGRNPACSFGESAGLYIGNGTPPIVQIQMIAGGHPFGIQQGGLLVDGAEQLVSVTSMDPFTAETVRTINIKSDISTFATRVGISTTTPTASFAVTAHIAEPFFDPNYRLMTLADSNDLEKFTVVNDARTGIGSSTPWGLLSVNPTSALGTRPSFVIGSSTATRFIVNNAGNVGIGSTSPSARFSITGSGTGTGRAFAVANSSNINQFIVQDNGSALFGTRSSTAAATPLSVSFGGTYGNSTPGSANNLKWYLYDDGVSANSYGIGMSTSLMEFRAGSGAGMAFYSNNGVEAMRITSAGNIGLGTTTPASKLDVRVVNGVTDNTLATFATQNWGGLQISQNVVSGFALGTGVRFKYLDESGTATTLLTLLKTGNIGIGTTTPRSKITVNGDIGTDGATPTLTGAGTGAAITVGSTDTAGEITQGTLSTGAIITFATTKARAPFCTITSQGGLQFSYTVSSSAITITNIGSLSGTSLNYMCINNDL